MLSSPLFGAASNSQAMAPRNGGVTNDAVTISRTVRRNGMSVRATSQPLIEMGDQSTAFNAVLVSYISQLAQELAELREEVARLSADRGPEDTRRA